MRSDDVPGCSYNDAILPQRQWAGLVLRERAVVWREGGAEVSIIIHCTVGGNFIIILLYCIILVKKKTLT